LGEKVKLSTTGRTERDHSVVFNELERGFIYRHDVIEYVRVEWTRKALRRIHDEEAGDRSGTIECRDSGRLF
jgi:hypothetical protein